MNKKEFDKAIKEVKKRMYQYKEPQKSKKGLMIGLGLAVIAALVGVVLWIRSKNDEDIEEYYEYFDDEMEDELEDEELYGLEDEIDEEDEVEYVQIKNFSEEDLAELEDEVEDNEI